MKITSVNLEADSLNGLSEIKMPRLSSVVLIAGKNGAGKSRLLTSIKGNLGVKPKKAIRDRSVQKIEKYLEAIDGYEHSIVNSTEENSHQVDAWHNQISKYKDSIVETKKIVDWEHINTDRYSDNYVSFCVDFVPKDLNLRDCNSLNLNDIRNAALAVESLGVSRLSAGVLSKIKTVQDRWYETSNQMSSASEPIKQQAKDEYDALVQVIDEFLGIKLDRNPAGDATLFGLRLGECKLSDGQIILLQLCVAIHSQGKKLNELILFLDEPENHLHPAALIEVVDRLSKVLTDGQLWIATHSIHLLSHFDSSSIWYMEDGGISYSGSHPEKVLEGLVGDDERIGKLSQFLTLPAELAQARFALQSLLPPETIEFDGEDPQTEQIMKALDRVRETGEPIRLLDFGAGKARLLSAAETYSNLKGVPVDSWLDYYAFDLPDSEDAIVAQNVINGVYGEGVTRYFNDEQILLAAMVKQSFDFVLMCNVFHELDPNSWTVLFNEQSPIRTLLKDTGKLMVVEDQLIPIGEKAYKNGFLVFDELQFQRLFKIDIYDCQDARGDGRLKAHMLPSLCLGNLDACSRTESIDNLRYIAEQKIRSLRDGEPTYRNGRLHGFWIQQYANASLCLAQN